MDNHQQHHQSAYARPQPRPHQHPAHPYAHGSFAEPALSYGSSDASGSDWASDSFSFSNPSNVTGYSSTSDPSSVGSFDPKPPSAEQLSLAHSTSSFSPTLYQTNSPTATYDPYAYAPTFSAPRFAQPNSGSSLEFNQGRALVEPDTSSALSAYEAYGGGQEQQYGSIMGTPQFVDGGHEGRAGGGRSNPFNLVDGSGFLPESQLSPLPSNSRSNSFSFSPDPAGVGMMGPPPRPSQRAYSAYAPRSLDTSRLPSNIYGAAAYGPTSALSPYKGSLAPPSPATFSMNPTAPSDPFNSDSIGLTMPQTQTKDWKGVYSTSGFDMASVLAKVASRPNPQIALGPVDLGCSFVVVDAKKWDQPIVFASETFSRLTGYSNVEIIGRNCRFLQAPDGVPVRQGEKRKYTDGNAAHHLRRHLVQGQESQASLINYCKGGKPFINLVTIVPITWDSDEIAYFVGFQVDLVEQPSAIMEKMRDGSYIVNYSLSVNSIPASLEPPQVEPFGDLHPMLSAAPMDIDSSGELLRTIGETGVAGLADDGSKKQFNRLLLEHCDDFVHVLSLKGSLLYVSPSSKRLLEYDPTELVGRTLATICHPSDIVAVLRELKEAGPNTPVNIVYRVRRKNSGYVWLEATGKLHLEQGKGRKCVILVGRPREVYRMSWTDLERLGGFGTTEYWSKLTIGGLYLYSTPSVEKVLGKTSEEMTGTTLAQLSPNGDATEILAALQQAANGHATTTRHQLVATTGIVDVVTHFYPARSDTDIPSSPMLLPSIKSNALTVIAQTNLFASEVVKPRNVSLPSAPSSRSSSSSSGSTPQSPISFTLPSFASSSTGSDGDESSGTNSSTSFSAITSTFKKLAPSSSVSDNVFDELDSVRGTSWQFELHQMRLTNKKLREEKEALLAMQRKKRKRAAGGDKVVSPAGGSSKSAKRSCANCGRSSSAEWRTGPTGPKTLCNACGLRWSKVRPSLHSNASSSSGNASTDSGTLPMIPSTKPKSSRASSIPAR